MTAGPVKGARLLEVNTGEKARGQKGARFS